MMALGGQEGRVYIGIQEGGQVTIYYAARTMRLTGQVLLCKAWHRPGTLFPAMHAPSFSYAWVRRYGSGFNTPLQTDISLRRVMKRLSLSADSAFVSKSAC